MLKSFLEGVKVKSPKLRGEEESGEEEAELNLKKPTPGIFLKDNNLIHGLGNGCPNR